MLCIQIDIAPPENDIPFAVHPDVHHFLYLSLRCKSRCRAFRMPAAISYERIHLISPNLRSKLVW